MATTIVHSGESLPSIAESCGHAGEWQTLAALNPQVIDPGEPVEGTVLTLPPGWNNSADGSDREEGADTEDVH